MTVRHGKITHGRQGVDYGEESGMSDEQSGIEVSDLGAIPSTVIPASEVKPEDVGALSLRYVDGVPQLVVSGGKAIPATLLVVDETASQVATYTAAQPIRTRSATVSLAGADGLTLPGYDGTNVEIDDNALFIYREHDILARLEKN